MDAQHLTLSVPSNFTVQSIGTNSGVYIGQKNVVVGVSHSSKENTGFGSISGARNLVLKNVGVVYDPDTIDTLIDDRDVKVIANTGTTVKGDTNILFNSMAVATMTQNAGVFVGETDIAGLDTHEKDNVGFGKVYGHQNVHHSNVSLNYDPDLVDTPINDQDIKIGFTSQHIHLT